MKTVISVFVVLFILIVNSNAQVLVEEPSSKYQNDEWGFTAAIANQGVGFGGFYLKNLSDKTYLGINLAFYKNRDKYAYNIYTYDPIYPYVEINGNNNLYLIPFSVEFKRHFLIENFANDIRPYIFSQVGGIFGMNFPDNDDRPRIVGNIIIYPDDNEKLDNEFQFGAFLGIGLSLDIATKKKVFFSVKPVYNWIYFPAPIAQEKWHSALELQFVLGLRK